MEEAKQPPFTNHQILSGTDVVRKWREKVEPRLTRFLYVLVFSGSEPRTTVMPYRKFENLWQRAEAAVELELRLEVMSRVPWKRCLPGSEALTLITEHPDRVEGRG